MLMSTSPKILKLHNFRLSTPTSSSLSPPTQTLTIVLATGKVTSLCPTTSNEVAETDDCEIVDCENLILAPGFIDIQLNGGYGVDFSLATSPAHNNNDKNTVPSLSHISHDQISSVSQKLLSTGVTSYLPTLISCSSTEYRGIIPIFEDYISKQSNSGTAVSSAPVVANVLGLHLEGPFFNVDKKGAHNSNNIRHPNRDSVTVDHSSNGNGNGTIQLASNASSSDLPPLSASPQSHTPLPPTPSSQDKEEAVAPFDPESMLLDTFGPMSYGLYKGLSILTLAPELPGSLDLIRHLTSTKSTVNCSMGHSQATYQQGVEGLRAGANCVTHIYNAMRQFHHR